MNNKTGLFPHQKADIFFILVIPALAIIVGAFVSVRPDYFLLILMLNLWLLGYHHVISTFTRIGFDTNSIKEHWKLLFPLPVFVLIAVLTIYQMGGAIILGSVYLYWQWYHYSRQSEGVAKAYSFKCADSNFARSTINRTMFYTVPFTTFFYMISGGPEYFLNIPILTISLSTELRLILMIISFSAALLWLIKGLIALAQKKISFLYYIYTLSHYSIYLTAYIFITEIDYSWLTINIWHNAQYIGFVWLFNRKKYSSGIDKKHLIISYISQPNRFFIYFGSCLILSLAVYWAVNQSINQFSGDNKIALIFIVYAAINFHHYIVDSQIWKLRKPQIKKTLTE
ncbi:hypothetical protein [Rheinheimera sp. WS51]|uniref:hypothetical protein n=1 Tax=Rheinheimera sp. WS51 TaxID=3425886 RepID=UPI003D93A403